MGTFVVQTTGYRTLWLAHRRELIKQARESLRKNGIHDIGVIAAGHLENRAATVQVASVQTLARRVVPNVDLVVIDEAHHATASQYAKVLNTLPHARVLGLTATPFRLDGAPLGDIFTHLEIAAYPDQLCDDGTLVEPIVYAPDVPDLEGVRVRMGDYSATGMAAAMDRPRIVGNIVETWRRLAAGKRTVVFAVNVPHSQHIVEAFREAGVQAEHLDGNTSKADRDATLARLKSGGTQVVSNCMVLCLDDKTEVLTSAGWVCCDDMTGEHEVANWWPDGSVTFEAPEQVVRRPRGASERMVRLQTPRADFRVTEGHWMLHRCPRGRWRKSQARDLVGSKFEFPISGLAEPSSVPVDESVVSERRRGRLLSKTRYNLTHLEGLTSEEADAEAVRRVDRRLSLRRKSPIELTEDECRFIGFWIGDGSRTELQSGGVEYSVSQSPRYASIVEWFDGLVNRLGLDVRRVVRDTNVPHVRWSFPRGTGGGNQQRKGIYHLEPFLDKQGSELLWGLDRGQFRAFLQGLWMADGNHGTSANRKSQLVIYSAQKELLDLIQAIAVCRGHRARIAKCSPPKRQNHRQLWRLSYREASAHGLFGRDVHLPQIESGWAEETVWCVKTTSRNIITRRNGCVTIMGNTEGWDLPALEVAIIARPTASLNLHLQTVGRIMRSAPEKQGAIVLDHAGNHLRHGSVTQRIEYSLSEKQKPKAKQERDGIAPMRRCLKCYALSPMAATACQECGAEFPAPELPRSEKGELVQLADRHASFEDRQAFWNRTEAQRVLLGFAEGWAAHRYRARFGSYPVLFGRELVDTNNPRPEHKRAEYARLFGIAKSKGYKLGWAGIQFKNRFGYWPPRSWQAAEEARFAATAAGR
jgi:superfamily II DNA or RNA helicase